MSHRSIEIGLLTPPGQTVALTEDPTPFDANIAHVLGGRQAGYRSKRTSVGPSSCHAEHFPPSWTVSAPRNFHTSSDDGRILNSLALRARLNPPVCTRTVHGSVPYLNCVADHIDETSIMQAGA